MGIIDFYELSDSDIQPTDMIWVCQKIGDPDSQHLQRPEILHIFGATGRRWIS